jgi:hypothetical protein
LVPAVTNHADLIARLENRRAFATRAFRFVAVNVFATWRCKVAIIILNFRRLSGLSDYSKCAPHHRRRRV